MKRWILYLVIGLITYGSLYPFHFSIPASHNAAWATLFQNGSLWSSRMDVLGNVLLFAPFGFVGVLSIAVSKSLATRILSVALTGLAVAMALQIAQIYVPERSAAISDVFWNLIGMGLGVTAGLSARLSTNRLSASNTLPLGVIALWLVAELLPFVPTLDVQSIKHNLKGILRPEIAVEQLLFHAAGTLIAARALADVVGKSSTWHWLFLLAGMVAVGKVFVITLTLNISVLVGLAAGCSAWWCLGHWREPRRGTVVMLVLMATYAYGVLMPFELRSSPESFSWTPFAGLLRGSMLANVQALTANLCLYAGILWITKTMGGLPVPSSIAIAGFVLIFETIQIFLVGRTPDITEPLLVLLLGQILRATPQSITTSYSTPLQDQTKPSLAALPKKISVASTADGIKLSTKKFNVVQWGAGLGTICLVMAFAFSQILRLPQLPYNVVELFLDNGSFPFLVIFALALLWIGAGARFVSYYVTASERPWLALPLLSFGASIVSLLLLYASVTDESIGDISGSNNLHWFVVNKEIWGEWARELFTLLPVSIVNFFERPVRYAALSGPLITFLALMFIGIEISYCNRMRMKDITLLMISTFLWLWLCKGIAFDWSSTDNLNELIAKDGPAGWGGGGYLYALVAVICANAVLLSCIRPSIIWAVLAVGLTCAAVPVGWWLLNNGLEQHVHKYSQVFSGAQFLLGPDRKELLSQEVLFLRWTVVQLSGVLVIVTGARIVEPVIDWLFKRRITKDTSTSRKS